MDLNDRRHHVFGPVHAQVASSYIRAIVRVSRAVRYGGSLMEFAREAIPATKTIRRIEAGPQG